MTNHADDTRWARLSERIAEWTGLHFPRDRVKDLKRGVAAAAKELGFSDARSVADWLLRSSYPTTPAVETVANHLTIGETYFFRDRPALVALAETILPELIHRRRGHNQELRLWSAACCSGEEPYSLAVIVHQLLPDLADWRVTIAASDINSEFLEKATAGTYGEWSFRNAPEGFKERYFSRTEKHRYAIRPDIKGMVTFSRLNLVEFTPSASPVLDSMDVILCRNALMYFTPAKAQDVIGRLRHALREDGWLIVSPSEASKALFPSFTAVNRQGAILFQKRSEPNLPQESSRDLDAVSSFPADADFQPWTPQAPPASPPSPERPNHDERRDVRTAPVSRFERSRDEEVVAKLAAAFASHRLKQTEFPLIARALANLGRLAEARTWCERWISSDKSSAAAYYLLAMVLTEQGELDEARRSLQRAIYLSPDLVLAHFALGSLARNGGQSAKAAKHFANAANLLDRYNPDDPLPEAEGLTAGRLAETINAMTLQETIA